MPFTATPRKVGTLYRRNGKAIQNGMEAGGFTGWLAERLPHLSKTTAYRCIEIFQSIDPALFPATGNIQPFVLAEVAKAEPDIQALIAARIEAGEIFTAAIERGGELLRHRGGAGRQSKHSGGRPPESWP
ncbi:hypothetical protein GOC94_24515 [Sinorhizobium medicae]|nr:hypothetical protein [Sinorhizobium medicae]